MASKYDLTSVEFKEYQTAEASVRSWKIRFTPVDESLLVMQFKKYGAEAIVQAVNIAASIEARSLTELGLIAGMVVQYTIARVEAATNDAVRMGWKSLDSIQKLLGGQLKAVRGGVGNEAGRRRSRTEDEQKPQRAVKVKKNTFPNKHYQYDGPAAVKWMVSKKPGAGDITEFFDNAGVDNEETPIYILRTEYR
jgi:hypothetical protein